MRLLPPRPTPSALDSASIPIFNSRFHQSLVDLPESVRLNILTFLSTTPATSGHSPGRCFKVSSEGLHSLQWLSAPVYYGGGDLLPAPSASTVSQALPLAGRMVYHSSEGRWIGSRANRVSYSAFLVHQECPEKVRGWSGRRQFK